MLAAAADGIAFAAVIFTIVDALLAYPRLPARIPINFNLRGEPGNDGPKQLVIGMVWALAIFLLVILMGVEVHDAASAGGAPWRNQSINIAALLTFLAYTQHSMFDAVQRREGHLAIQPLLLGALVLFAILAVANSLR